MKNVPKDAPELTLRGKLYALSDLLVLHPLPRRPVLRARASHALAAAEAAGASGLLPHLLRDLLADLDEGDKFDARFYAVRLSRAAERLDA